MSVEGLIQWLRRFEQQARFDGHDGLEECSKKAADKLEELAAALRIAQGNTDAAIEDYNEAQTALAEAKRQNEALREALKRLVTDADAMAHYTNSSLADEAIAIASEALARNAGGKDGE